MANPADTEISTPLVHSVGFLRQSGNWTAVDRHWGIDPNSMVWLQFPDAFRAGRSGSPIQAIDRVKGASYGHISGWTNCCCPKNNGFQQICV